MKRKLILIELNEVPYRVIDAYTRLRPPSLYVTRLLPRQPVHNGCGGQVGAGSLDQLAHTAQNKSNDEVHRILHLGQLVDEADDQYPPIWAHSKGSWFARRSVRVAS